MCHQKIKFSPSNVDVYERLFKLEHDVSMGYKTPDVPCIPKVQSAVETFMEEHPVPSPLHKSFRCWIARNALAKFDCFEDPYFLCVCCKCATWQKKEDHEITMMVKTDVSCVSTTDSFLGTLYGAAGTCADYEAQ